MDSFPYQLSGGMRQRVVIAMALSCEPQIVIADEPTTALDVTTQARVMSLLLRLSQARGAAVILITHDLEVAAEFCDDIQVMYAGRIVESSGAEALFTAPRHPYARALLESRCVLTTDLDQPIPTIPGQPPQPGDFPSGCSFASRCPRVQDICLHRDPVLESEDGRAVACHFPYGADRVLAGQETA
jgi:oligopeptide/dipeptide ABC transporter ATP-binding protein